MAFLQLVLQSLLMGAGTFGLGWLPLYLSKQRSSWTSHNSHAVAIFSVGLLISTALSVIIPEGVGVVLRSVQSGREGEREGEVHEHLSDSDGNVSGWIGAALVAGFVLMFCVHQGAASQSHSHESPPSLTSAYKKVARSSTDANKDLEAPRLSEHEAGPLPAAINEGSGDYFGVSMSLSERTSELMAADPLDSASPAFSTYVGLLFHALADGVALGAASMTVTSLPGSTVGEGVSGLSFVVFISLIIHKAPVAFSLTTLLLSYSPPSFSRIYYHQVKRALVLFSLATPLGAAITWILLKILTLASWSDSMDESAEEDGNIEGLVGGNMRGKLEFWSRHFSDKCCTSARLTTFAAGMALLFSAGTFLFVSTHVMADIESSTSGDHSTAPNPISTGSVDTQDTSMRQSSHGSASSRRQRILLFLGGMMTPLVLNNLFHAHHTH